MESAIRGLMPTMVQRPAGAVSRIYRHPVLVLALVVLLAAALATYRLGAKSIWLDEAISVAYAQLDWSSLWHVIAGSDRNMSLYYVVLHLWTNIGESEVAVRSLSVLFALATLPVVYALGSVLFGPRVGATAAMLLTVNPFFVQYAQEARGYSLVLLLASLSSYLFLIAVERPSRRLWAGYAICTALAIHAHFFAILVVVAHMVSLVVLRPGHVPWKGVLISGATVALISAPQIVGAMTGPDLTSWIREPSLGRLLWVLRRLAGGSRLLSLVYAMVCSAALVPALKIWGGRRTSRETWPYAFLASWLLLPIVLAFSFSFLKPVLVPRYLIVCIPPLALLASVGICRVPARYWLVVLGVIVALSGRGLYHWYANAEKEEWRSAANYVASDATLGDAIMFHSYFVRHPFLYYLDRLHAPADLLVQLPDPDDHLLASLPSQYDRVWVVLSHADRGYRAQRSRLIQSSMYSDYAIAADQHFTGVRVLLYERRF